MAAVGVGVSGETSPFLTISELADRLGVSESTVRNWRKAHGDLIAQHVGRDGIRRYRLSTYREIAALRERDLPAAAIRAALIQGGSDSERAPETFEAGVLLRLDRIIAAVERIVAHLEEKKDRSCCT